MAPDKIPVPGWRKNVKAINNHNKRVLVCDISDIIGLREEVA